MSDPFTAADLPDFLEQSILGVNDALANPASQKGMYVGNMEHNAYLASFQRARQATSRGRIANWAARYTDVNVKADAVGPFGLQLRGIGVKLDDEFINKILGIGQVESTE